LSTSIPVLLLATIWKLICKTIISIPTTIVIPRRGTFCGTSVLYDIPTTGKKIKDLSYVYMMRVLRAHSTPPWGGGRERGREK
jgi:hypothetical protein